MQDFYAALKRNGPAAETLHGQLRDLLRDATGNDVRVIRAGNIEATEFIPIYRMEHALSMPQQHRRIFMQAVGRDAKIGKLIDMLNGLAGAKCYPEGSSYVHFVRCFGTGEEKANLSKIRELEAQLNAEMRAKKDGLKKLGKLFQDVRA